MTLCFGFSLVDYERTDIQIQPTLTESALTFEIFPVGRKLKIKADSFTTEEKHVLGLLGELEAQKKNIYIYIKTTNNKTKK